MLPPPSACLSRRRVSANGGKKAEQAEQEKSESHWISSFCLKRTLGEVSNMILTEYDEQKHNENEKKWSFEEGERYGKETGKALGKNLVNELNQRLIEDGRMEDLKRACQETEYQKELLKEYGFNEE